MESRSGLGSARHTAARRSRVAADGGLVNGRLGEPPIEARSCDY